jgi:hypothetical protein
MLIRLVPVVVVVSLAFAASGFAQPGKITDPAVAARRLYEAWRARDRRAALKIADKAAVDKLLSVRWRAMRAKGCEHRDGGEGFQCVYEDARRDLRLAVIVEGGASAGYGVTAVSFSSEE